MNVLSGDVQCTVRFTRVRSAWN